MIITTGAKVDKYLAMLAHQNPIESQLLSILPDALNAEIALGTIHDIEEGLR